MDRLAFGYSIRLEDVAPVRDPLFVAAGFALRAEVLRWVLVYGLEEKDKDLAAGIGADGSTLAPIAKSTREHRRSEMGPASPSAPPLTPAYHLSRTRALLTGDVDLRRGRVDFYWKYDNVTGGSWGQILDYHRRGAVNGGKVRDVIGISPDALDRVRDRVLEQWQAFKLGMARTPERILPVPPSPAPRFLVRPVKAYVPQFAELAVPANGRRVSQIEVNGKVYTLGASSAGNPSAAAIMRGIENGTFSGFRRRRER